MNIQESLNILNEIVLPSKSKPLFILKYVTVLKDGRLEGTLVMDGKGFCQLFIDSPDASTPTFRLVQFVTSWALPKEEFKKITTTYHDEISKAVQAWVTKWRVKENLDEIVLPNPKSDSKFWVGLMNSKAYPPNGWAIACEIYDDHATAVAFVTYRKDDKSIQFTTPYKSISETKHLKLLAIHEKEWTGLVLKFLKKENLTEIVLPSKPKARFVFQNVEYKKDDHGIGIFTSTLTDEGVVVCDIHIYLFKDMFIEPKFKFKLVKGGYPEHDVNEHDLTNFVKKYGKKIKELAKPHIEKLKTLLKEGLAEIVLPKPKPKGKFEIDFQSEGNDYVTCSISITQLSIDGDRLDINVAIVTYDKESETLHFDPPEKYYGEDDLRKFLKAHKKEWEKLTLDYLRKNDFL